MLSLTGLWRSKWAKLKEEEMNREIRNRMWLLKPLRWLRAFVGGYFWLPCPICGENFGGFEWGESLMSSWDGGEGVCPACSEEADRLNQIRWKTTSPPVRWYHPIEHSND